MTDSFAYRKFKLMRLKIAIENRIPIFGYFELTPLCNLDCRMCYVHLQDSSVGNRLISGERWIQIMRETVEAGLQETILTGGEAMSHPDFKDIYMFLASQGIRTSVKTNGILLNDEMIKLFKEYPPRMIDVSLYGCDRESYMEVTGRDAFDTVTTNIRKAVESGLNVRIMITPSRYMLSRLDGIFALAKSFGTQVIVNSLLCEANDDTGRYIEEYGLSLEEYLMIDEKKKEIFPEKYLSEEENVELAPYYEEVNREVGKNKSGLRCGAGKYCFAISWEGKLRPCINFPEEIASAKPFEMGFSDAWKQITETIDRYTVPAECEACEVADKCHYCPTMHGKKALEGECSPSVCDFWKKKYAK